MTDKPEFGAEMQQIAHLILQNLPDDWEKSCVTFEDYGRDAFCISSYSLVDGNKMPFAFPEDEFDAIAELFFAIQKKCIDPWKAAMFELNEDGKFKIDFKY